MKAEWRFALAICGVLCVPTTGEVLMPLWYVGNWASLQMVSYFLVSQ